ncbi:MAG: hypothetical protein GY770_21990 [Aestuariibacter sp.]|nr:hypothetical protein [Aestuariibacter sp.]
MTPPDDTSIHQSIDDEDDKMQMLTRREVFNYFCNSDDSWEKPVENASRRLLRKLKNMFS